MVYTIIIIIALAFSYAAEKTEKKIYVYFVALLLSFLSGLRGITVGIDTANYYSYIENVRFSGIRFGSDIGFSALCSILLPVFNSAEYLLLIFAVATNYLIVFRSFDFEDKASFFVMMSVYIVLQFPYSFNIVRQYLAVAIIFFASRYIEQGKNWIYIILNIIAVSIHAASILGFAYLLIYKINSKKSKSNIKYITVIAAMLIAFILMNQFNFGRYYKYFENSVVMGFSFLTFYRFFCVLLIVVTSRQFASDAFSITKSGSFIALDKNVSLLCFCGIVLCAIGMFQTFMNRIGFYFITFEMPFWGQACRSVNIVNRRLFKTLLFVMLVYVYIVNCSSNDVANYTTFFQIQ